LSRCRLLLRLRQPTDCRALGLSAANTANRPHSDQSFPISAYNATCNVQQRAAYNANCNVYITCNVQRAYHVQPATCQATCHTTYNIRSDHSVTRFTMERSAVAALRDSSLLGVPVDRTQSTSSLGGLSVTVGTLHPAWLRCMCCVAPDVVCSTKSTRSFSSWFCSTACMSFALCSACRCSPSSLPRSHRHTL
jgi:hypothetical protein